MAELARSAPSAPMGSIDDCSPDRALDGGGGVYAARVMEAVTLVTLAAGATLFTSRFTMEESACA